MIKPIKGSEGACVVCGTNYLQRSSEGSGYYYCEFTNPCPSCRYNPGIKEKIEKIISQRAIFTITTGPKQAASSPSVRVNSDELVSLIVEELKKYWPTNRGKK